MKGMTTCFKIFVIHLQDTYFIIFNDGRYKEYYRRESDMNDIIRHPIKNISNAIDTANSVYHFVWTD